MNWAPLHVTLRLHCVKVGSAQVVWQVYCCTCMQTSLCSACIPLLLSCAERCAETSGPQASCHKIDAFCYAPLIPYIAAATVRWTMCAYQQAPGSYVSILTFAVMLCLPHISAAAVR
jgi:hypothetical protein